MVNKIPPIVIKPEGAFDDSLAPAIGGQPPEKNDFYFQFKPPNKPLTIKSSVVMRLPLYDFEALDDSIIPGTEGKISFQNIYRNYTPEDFARLMTTQGVLSKAIRYGLLYNYFGFPVANLMGGTQDYLEIEDTQFSFNNVKKRVVSRDKDFGTSHAPIDGGFGSVFYGDNDNLPGNELAANEFDAIPQASFVEYAKGLYQLGKIGEIPSFTEPPQQPPQYEIFKSLKSVLNPSIQNEFPGYSPVMEFFNFLHGSYTNGSTQASIGGSFSHVDVIGVDAIDSGLKVESFFDIQGFNQADLRFSPQWTAMSNPIPKTYIRAWRPSTKSTSLSYNEGDNPADVDLYFLNNLGIPGDDGSFQYTWNYDAANIVSNEPLIDSLSALLGSNQASSWVVNPDTYLLESNAPPGFINNHEFSLTNIASMYKLVPSQLDVSPTDLINYRKDPAKTLNKIYPRIFKYVRDVAPMYMIQQQESSGQGKINTPLNSSDIITPEAIAAPNGVENRSFLRKFRLGWEFQEHSVVTGKPVPSWEYDNLGPTHVIGTFDKNIAGNAYIDIIGQDEGQDINIKYFRNKISVIFKSELHQFYVLNSKGSDANSHLTKFRFAANGFFSPTQQNLLPEQTKGIFDPFDKFFIPTIFVQNYDKATTNLEHLLEKSYFMSTKLLSYLYLKRPSGHETGELLYNPLDIADLANELDINVFGGDGTGGEVLPSILNPNLTVEQIKSYLNAVSYSNEGQKDTPASKYTLQIDEETGTITDAQAEQFIETGILASKKPSDYGGKFLDFNAIDGTGDADEPDIKINQQSPFALPIWKYDEGSSQSLTEIGWKKLNDSPQKELDLEGVLSDNPSLTAVVNYGIPEWVTGLRIYPCPDKETIATCLDPNAGSNGFIQSPGPILNTYKDGEMEDVVSAAMKIVVEPRFVQGVDNKISTEVDKYVEIRYVVELAIDEKKLVLDMVGQGVASLDGTLEQYESAGFSIPELLAKSNGNVSSPDLIEAYEEGEYDFASGIGLDLNQFPSLFGSNPDLDCPPLPPSEVTQKLNQILIENPGDIYAVTSYVCLSDFNFSTVRFKEAPGPDSANIGYLDDNTTVKVLKEWVNGKGEYNKILVTDGMSPYDGLEGFIHPKYLRPISPSTQTSYKIFFEQKFPKYPLKGTLVTFMSDMAEALVPTWYREMDRPYYHRADGEYWVSVTMPNDCIVDEQDLEQQKELAKQIGLRKILDFQNKFYTDEELAALVDTYLVVRAEDYFLSARPGSKVKILVKVGGIYVNSLKSKKQNLSDLKDASKRILSLDSRYFDLHLQQALFSLNQIYLDIFSSEFVVSGINLAKEAERLSFVPTAIKKVIATNGYDIGKQTDSIINIGFDENYKLTFMSYIEDASEVSSKEEQLLSVGFDYFKEQEPFSFPYTMALLYYHRDIKNPLLKWQTIFKEWLPDPKPEILPKTGPVPLDLPSDKCGFSYFSLPPFTEIMNNVAQRLNEQLDLNPRYDLGAFQFSLMQFFPPCPKPPPGKGTAFFKFLSEIDGETTVAENGEFLSALGEEAERLEQYVGDFLSSGAALRDIKSKIFDMDDLYSYVLNYITPEVLYSKICKCFLDVIGVEDIGIPNLSINASGGSGGLNLDPATIANNPKQIFNSKGATFDTNFIDGDGNFKSRDSYVEEISAEDLFCSFCFRIPSVFFRLPTTDLLESLIQAIKAILEFALAQILLELIAALLDSLLTCPELKCTAGETRLKDYGAQNIRDLINTYSDQGTEVINNCGLVVDEVSLSQATVDDMLSNVSKSLTTPEVLGLFDGSASKEALETVKDVLFAYPSIEKQLNDIGKISDFFECVGKKMDPSLFDFLDQQSIAKVNDPVLCTELASKAKQLLKDKCGDIPGFDDIANKNLNHDLDKYKNLAKIIRDNDDLSSQLPPLFTDGKGTQGLLSGQKVETAEFALQKALDAMIISTEPTLIEDSNNLVKASKFKLVKESAVLKAITSLPDVVALPIAVGLTEEKYQNLLAGLEMPDESFKTLDQFLTNIGQAINVTTPTPAETKLQMDLSTEDFVHMIFNLPASDAETGQKIYTNNYEVEIVSEPSINVTVEGSQLPPISDEVKQFLDKYPLLNNNPEQAQFFSSVVLQSLGLSNTNDAGEVEIPNNASTKALKELFEEDIYYSVLSSMINQMGLTCGQSNLLKKSEIEPFSFASKLAFGATSLFVALATAASTAGQNVTGPDDLLPKFFKQELENLKLTQVGSQVGPQTVVDFNYGAELAKQAYDFSKYYDPNSEVIGMPHFAMLEAVVSWTMQLFVGETLMKSVAVLPFFPKELFFNELLIQFVIEQYKAWLDKQEPEFKWKWYALITRAIYEKPEFTPALNSNKPALPGEFGGGTQGEIDGTIFDTQLGREIEIKNWRDATSYYVRQSFERPLEFLKKCLKDTTLDSHDMDTEINPFNFICYKDLKEVHKSNYEQYEGDEPTASSLFIGDAVNEFKNGKFAFQFYFRLEDLEPGDPMYNEKLANRQLIKAIADPFGFDPPGDGEEEPTNPFQLPINPFDPLLEELGQLAPPIVPLAENLSAPNLDLKGVLNRFAIDELWNLMSNGSTNIIDGNFNISIEDQKKPFYEFFKSVKLGVRLVYALADSTEKDEEGNFITDQDPPQSPKTKEVITKILVAVGTNAAQNPELVEFQSTEKCLVVTQKTGGVGVTKTNYIFPVFSKEIEIPKSPGNPFSQPVNSYATGEQNPSNSTFSQISKYTKEGQGLSFLSKLVSDMSEGPGMQSLFSYSIPIQRLVALVAIYNALGVQQDEQLNSAFDSTKETLKQSFESIYDIKGSKAYAYEPGYIKRRGGARGIATSASSQTTEG